MKTLLVATNQEKAPFAVTPVGVLAVAGSALAGEHEVEFLDIMFEADPQAALVAAIEDCRPDAIAFGIRNLDNCYYAAPRSFFEPVRELVDAARAVTNAKIILGGSGFSVEPVGWLSRLEAHYGVVGEGEVAFVRLLDCLAAGREPAGIPAVVAKVELGSIKLAEGPGLPEIPTSFVPEIKTLTRPAHRLIDYRPYEANGGFVSIQAKRGCPFRCAYCVYPQLEGKTYRNRPVADIADEIQEIVDRQGVTHFFFSDSVFNTPHRHTVDLCEEIVRRALPIRWMAYVNSVAFDDELAEAMVAAGCLGVEFGLDAATEKMLVNWDKPFGQEEIRRSLQACERAGLPAAVHLLFGGPGETWGDIEEAAAFLDSCAPTRAVFASLGVRVYRGAPIARTAVAEGIIEPDADLFFPVWYVSPALGEDPMPHLDAVARRRDEWSTATDWSSDAMVRIQEKLNRQGARPQWMTLRDYGRYIRRRPTDLGLGKGRRRPRAVNT